MLLDIDLLHAGETGASFNQSIRSLPGTGTERGVGETTAATSYRSTYGPGTGSPASGPGSRAKLEDLKLGNELDLALSMGLLKGLVQVLMS
jgi:hypothetical protein